MEHFDSGIGNPRERLKVFGVSVRSPLNNTMALRAINLSVAPGQMVEIIGRSGEGKSLLAETIVGLQAKSAGQVLCDGINTARISDEEHARSFGFVPETPFFVPGSLADNISHLDPEVTPDKVIAAAKKACLHAWISALPDGYNTKIEASGAPLSKGQRQQVALARAVYFDPSILVIDEPDGMLLERIPETLKKTLDSILDRRGVIVLLGRKELPVSQTRKQYKLEKGTLSLGRTIRAEGEAPLPPSSDKVTVLSDKKAEATTSGSARGSS